MNRARKKNRPLYLKRTLALATGVVVVALGVLMVPGWLGTQPGEIPEPSPAITTDNPDDPGGIARPSPPAPERIQLSQQEARNDPDFGAFLPANMPDGFVFEDASRHDDTLMASWNRGMPSMDYISWVVHFAENQWRDTIVSVDDREKYDVSLYPIPWAATVPEEIWQVFQFPVFLAEELSLDVVQARMLQDERRGTGDSPSWRYAPFGVLYGDVLVQPRVNGVMPEQIWEMLATLG